MTKSLGTSTASSANLPPATVLNTLVLANRTFLPGNVVPENADGPVEMALDPQSGRLYAGTWGGAIPVVNTSSELLVGLIPTGSAAFGVAYDGRDARLFATHFGTGTLSVINTTTERVVGNVAVGREPWGVTYDTITDRVYVANYGSSTVSVIDAATDAVVGSVRVGNNPTHIAVDPATDELFVSNEGSGNVTEVNGTTDRVTGSVTVGLSPEGLAYDPTNGEVYVADFSTNGLTIFNGSTGLYVTTIAMQGGCPWGVAYDVGSAEVYVTTGCRVPGGNVTVVDASTNQVVSIIPLGNYLYDILYSGATGRVYVADYYGNNLWILNGSSRAAVGAVGTGEMPEAVAYDAVNDRMYVADWGGNDVAVLNASSGAEVGTIGSWYGPDGLAYDAATGELYVANSESNNVSVVNTSTGQVVASIPVGSDPQGIAYDPANGDLYVANCGSDNVSILNRANTTVVATVAAGVCPAEIAYDPVNGQLFVTNQGPSAPAYFYNGNVTVIDGTTNRAIDSIIAGGGPHGVAYDPANGNVYVANNYYYNLTDNNLSVIDGATDRSVGSILLGEGRNNGPWGLTYSPARHELLVTLSWVNSDLLEVVDAPTGHVLGTVAVGLWPSDVTVDSATGDAWVANQLSGTVSILNLTVYPPPRQSVTFRETGLIAGTSWSVTFNGTTNHSSTSGIAFSVPNGTYSFSVASVAGYLVHPAQGSFSVAGQNVTIVITFERLYAVTVTETGLPPGTSWSVAWNSTLWNSTAPALGWTVPNGSYPYAIPAVGGYAPTPASGTLVVNGAGRSLVVAFLPPPPRIVSFTVNRTTMTVGESVTVRVVVADGQAPLSYRYGGGPSGCGTGNVSAFTCTADVAGNYTLHVWVTDHAGRTTNATVKFTVTKPPPSGWWGTLDLPGAEGYLLVGVLAATLGAGAGIVLWRRHRQAPPPGSAQAGS